MQRNDFSQGDLRRTIVVLSIPMIGAQLINVLYNIVDRIYLGRIPGVGSTVLAGVGLTFPIITMVAAFACLAGMGGAPLVSIERGKGDERTGERIMGTCFTLLLLFGALCTALGLAFRAPILYLFGASPDTFASADAYAEIYLWGSVFVMITLGMNPFINAQGFTKTTMISVLIGAALNIALDPLFIFTLNMGVRGAALATVLSQFVSAVWTLGFLFSKRPILRLRFRDMKPDWRIAKQACALGFSNFTMRVTESAVQIVCNRQLGLFGGDVYITVMTIINSARQIIMMPLTGFSQAAQPVLGFNYGAKRYDRVKAGIRFTFFVCLCCAFASWALAMLAPEWVIRLFSDSEEVLRTGIPAVRMYFCAFFVMCLQMTGQYSFVSLGKARQATFFSLLRKAFIVVPLTLILPNFLGVDGVFLAEPISDFVGSIACFTTFMLTVWRKELK